MKRHRIPKGKSKRNFTRNAMKVNGKNNPHRTVMRGGIRL